MICLLLLAVQIAVPEGQTEIWRRAGIETTSPAAVSGYQAVPAPKLQMRSSAASATTVPWIDANGWRFQRGIRKAIYEKLPPGLAGLAMAESAAYGVEAVVQPDAQDLPAVKMMSAFLRKHATPAMPTIANIGLLDDGTPEVGEVMNLLGRRNLLFRVVKTADPKLDLNVVVGSAQFPRESTRNPNDFAARIREKLGDDKRDLRIYNTYTVIGHLTGDGERTRLFLLNYAKRPVKDIRVRVLGRYQLANVAEDTDEGCKAADVASLDGGTEFTIPALHTLAIVDLNRDK